MSQAAPTPDKMSSVDMRKRTRKSMTHVPMSSGAIPFEDVNKENEGRDGASEQNGVDKLGATSKKSRSKSLGPGGVDALQATSGNRRKVLQLNTKRQDD